MAQTAKIISPQKRVFLPNMQSGCLMADMINLEQLREFKAKNKKVPVVCYVNSTAEVKSECDICCTSSNALKIVKNLNVPEVLFCPDTYLGKWVEEQLKGSVKVTTFNGFCPTHLRITPEDMTDARVKYPNAKILAHPECHKEVCKLADFVGSTSQIMDYAKKSDAKEFIIGTENSIVQHLQFECPDKKFYPLSKDCVCHNMKLTTLADVYQCVLGTGGEEILLEDEIREKAGRCINTMLELGQ